MGSIESAHSNLQADLEEVHQRYVKDHPVSRKNHDKACEVMPGGNTRTVLHTTPFPLFISAAQSSYLTSADGHQYVDFLNEYTAGIYGHNHPKIRGAIEGALDQGWNYGAHHDKEAELAGLICTRFPAMELVRFVNSGTEANMMAIATALAFTGKRKVLLFEMGYHGSTISGSHADNNRSINLPHEFVIGRFNDVEGTKAMLSNEFAAILVEPVMGSGGCFEATKEFLDMLRTVATDIGALLIFDEVMTSRLHFQGRGAHMNVKPDLMTIGKYIGGGMSFGAFGGRRDIMKLYDPREGQLSHPGTFNNNVFSMSAGIAGASILSSQVLSSLNELGEVMKKEIEFVLIQHGITGKIPQSPILVNSGDTREAPKMFIKGVGSMMCIHFTGHNHSYLQGLFFHHMLTHGYYIAQRGFVSLSIENNKSQVDGFVEAVSNFCDRYQAELQ